MKIVIAPDKFKGSLSAIEAVDAIARGILAVNPAVEIDRCPMADGGEGTVATLIAACGGHLIHQRVVGPLPEMKVDATFGMLADGRTAVIEMAAASGLALLPIEDRNPLSTTTFGTGELITAAIRHGAKKIILGIGGSATIDAGIGCAQACGFTILLRDGRPISPTEPLCGRDLDDVLMVKHGRGEITNGIEIVGACDVTNPLFGPNGAAIVFGPQKGATTESAASLDHSLRELAGRMNLLDLADTPGAGAAGGLGFGLLAFFGTKLQSGFNLISDAIGLRQRLQNADLCITGEGQIDSQSSAGKVVDGVAKLSDQAGVPCIGLAGSVQSDAHSCLTASFSICDGPMPLNAAHQHAGKLLQSAAENCFRLFQAAHR